MKHSRGDRLLMGLSGGATLVLLGMLLAIVFWLASRGLGMLSFGFLSQFPSADMAHGGIFPAIVGTLGCTLLMTLAGVPVGIATAIYLHEYAPPRSLTARLVRAAVFNLAGVPSVVYGLFGLGFFILFVGRHLDGWLLSGAAGEASSVFGRPGILWASLTLAVLTLPVVIVVSEEALRSVRKDLREASLALGATRWQTIVHVVLPAAKSGLWTGAILAVSRGAGEVAPILFTGVATYLPQLPRRLDEGFMHLAYHVYVLATQAPDIAASEPALFGTAVVLLTVTLGLNAVGMVLRARSRQQVAA